MPPRMLPRALACALFLGCSGNDHGADGAPADVLATDTARDVAAMDSPADTPPGNDAASDVSSGDGGCASPVSSAPPVVLADFESGAIPSSSSSTEGFRDSDVTHGTIVHPGANGTAAAAQFDYSASNAVFFQGNMRPQYLNGSSSYEPDLANAVEMYVRVPAGSGLLASSGTTFGFWTYEWNPGDPWVGPNASGGNLTDSQMHGYANFRFAAAAADRWVHVVLSSSAFAQSRGNYHFYAARAVVQDLTVFGALRQFELVALGTLSGAGAQLGFDEMRLVTLPPTASVCPPFASQTVPASGGDVRVPVSFVNPTATGRHYRVFLSSEIGIDRQTLESAMHDTDNVATIDDLQGGVGADGSVGAVELFAADASGAPMGSSIVATGSEIVVGAGMQWSGVLVHHVTPAMLGAMQNVSSQGHTFAVRRDTLTTSMIVWDPNAPHAGDTDVVFGGSNADQSHPAPPGFPAYHDPAAGWRSTDVPMDQVGGYFVSVLRLM